MSKVYMGLIAILVCACLTGAQTKERNVMLAAGTSIDAELQKTVDARNAKVGDEVILKTRQSIKQDGTVVVPKGSRLIGRITEIQERTRENTGSRIGMIFDRIQGKQLSMPLNATLVSITKAAATASIDDSMTADLSGSSAATTSSSRSSSGGGLLGGVSNAVGGVVNTTTQTVGTVTDTAGRTVSSASGTVGRTLRGVQIQSEVTGSASSTATLASPSRNVRVEKGATFHLRVEN